MKVDPKQLKGRWPNILVGLIITIFAYLTGAAFPPAAVGFLGDVVVDAVDMPATSTHTGD